MQRVDARAFGNRSCPERELSPPSRSYGGGHDRATRGWIVEDPPTRGLALLAGKPKAGKTNFVATLAHAVSQGLLSAGMTTVQTPVLYIAAEESEEGWNLSVWPHPPEDRTGLWVGRSGRFRVDHEPDLWSLRQGIDHDEAGLVVVDPLLAAVAYGDFARANQARGALTGLESLYMDKSVAAIVVHHAKESRGLARRVADKPAARRHRQPEHGPQPPLPIAPSSSSARGLACTRRRLRQPSLRKPSDRCGKPYDTNAAGRHQEG